MPRAPGLPARPVAVLTGALGAGKTTLLNAALREHLLGRVAVVVNEFGAAGIDHELVESSTEDVVVLPGGCVCCTVRADLAEALSRLDRAAAGDAIPAFDRVLIETSGLAEPGPILQLFAESPQLAGRFRLDVVIAVVDALLGAAALAREDGTASRQALLADRVLLTKWEGAPAADLAALEARLAAINPFAERLRAPRGTARDAWFDAPPPGPMRVLPAGALRAAHDDAIESFVLGWDDGPPLESIGDWLHALAEQFGARLLRVKGIVAARDAPGAVAIHAVQHLVAPPEYLSAPAPASGSRVVFIVRGLEPDDVCPPWPVTTGSH